MAADPRKRQRKLAKRSAKRKAKHHELVREKSAGLPERLAAAADYPIVDCLATTDLWDQGLGWIRVSRALPGGGVAAGMFLVDRYCLGVKSAMGRLLSRYEYDTQVLQKMQSQLRSKAISPATARQFVESAVDYAHSLGFAPHPDYHRVKPIFGTIDPAEATEALEFGKDGKPFFIAGPNDNQARCREILATLERRCGPGGSHFLIPLHGAEPTSIVDADEAEE